ncbi:MAG: RNA polymerase sigma factor, partial [Actinomycetes bacterium]
FTLQAAIAAEHARATSYDVTDWSRLLQLYDALLRVWPTPVVALNRAVVLAMVDGPAAALEVVDGLVSAGKLSGYRYLPATRADLLRRLGRGAEAADAYRSALDLAENEAERRFLTRRLAEVSDD